MSCHFLLYYLLLDIYTISTVSFHLFIILFINIISYYHSISCEVKAKLSLVSPPFYFSCYCFCFSSFPECHILHVTIILLLIHNAWLNRCTSKAVLVKQYLCEPLFLQLLCLTASKLKNCCPYPYLISWV